MTSLDAVDVVIVGAGIVGLAHAVEAVERGMSVVVLERDEWATGASVRNFGHGCFTAQDGTAYRYAKTARETWLKLAKLAGLTVRESGTVVVARAEDELAVLKEFAEVRPMHLLSAAEVEDLVPTGPDVIGGALLPLDIRVDQRTSVGLIAKWLARQGVRFHWGTTAHLISPGEVVTSRGRVAAARIIVAVGHNVDRHFPSLADEFEVRRCALRMLRVANPHGRDIHPAVLSGHSLLRYSAFSLCPTLPEVQARISREQPSLVDIGLNLMYTQRPDGSLTIGDTHAYHKTLDPFEDNELDRTVLSETAHFLGVPSLTVLEHWRGVYASAPQPYLVASPADGVRVAAVTSGIGMTTAFGLAPDVLDTL
ncbi:TIGR03364 family FAD-dependent oxidoreductase [Kibdelosporangium philippinense]|uniref:TIGR03364 family FAD-dependent oxidoreductase n=1 Tax=Kibdelosporangium philippinense TaxID=211113 RepID=A0ABS8ZKI7_9PSEU|nr:TIGR03364 family FAD-dependent oxidoreductase [Kibdelosporangium philippinense]MCE7007151.1 TIGR03364 family FAD-dependent oxidoreductase [Kibdelosporangium philippinense]